MGTYDRLSNHAGATASGNFSTILVVASAVRLAPLNGSRAGALPSMLLKAHQSDEPISEAHFAGISLAIIEVNPSDPASIGRISAVRERHPTLPLIAAIDGASVSLVRALVREGISDIVSLPFEVPELLQVTLEAAARRDARPGRQEARAPLIAVVRSIGGCGATSLATHLAADLAAHDESGRGTVIVDLDLQFGSVADYLGITARGSIADLLGVQDRLDEELLRSVTVEAAGGVSVIAAPDMIMPLESVDTDDLLRLLGMLRRQYGHVVLDLPANWTNWSLSAALTADMVVLVVELTIASLRQAKRRLELFRSVGIEDSAVQIVVNRVEKQLFRTIDLKDVSGTLGHSALGIIALDAPAVNNAQNQGLLVGEFRRKSKFAADILQIGALLRSAQLARSS